ncbi:MAG: restriction endonuclease [Chloroflexi bacterium]|nr:restriction endonuclease [Chloroflexota bacterium]
MNLAVVEGYKSQSQIARRLTEDWATRNLYCLACASAHLDAARANTAVWDYSCAACGALYQLKSQNKPFGRRVSNSEYYTKMRAIAAGRAPHYAFLHYSISAAAVVDLFVVPGHFLSPAVVERRPPLPPHAKRAGWVGSNILLGELPEEGRVHVVEAGTSLNPLEVRDDWQRYQFLAGKKGGWAADVLSCIRVLERETKNKEFTLQDFYQRFEAELAWRHTDNRNVQAKIRQQLQVLAKGKVLSFVDNRGRYRVIG